MPRVVLGIGCDRGAAEETVAAAVAAALAEAGLCNADVVAVASIDLKRDEPALHALARAHGWPLVFYPATQLAAIPVPHPSEVVRRHTGTPAVAEAAALCRADADSADLIIEKRRWRGGDGRNATVSIARLNA
ncbi:MAG: cobalamin biosynthesis protein [Halorhodospira halophila]|uniref:cobalamin biosynthesis protein n=1 Tax=Halorhodospira TaxID=85108 RepID=UPI0019145A5E|nr:MULTISPECIES: cobalamin biosynthesis protein [Halorhodospira]MBK5936006.1 cobalamin biosynthesis protein CbiG [Halorhodospira halophila]MBK5943667.1 cobalamin biosynthesis protein CbiG [Halorhodospira halophila]MCC3750011.1 cobalamin biosynthesis protein [Halorhodospira halophila]MCG5529158.1 cobalamin biosynthesis protein [Halorhodospira halophila]MCG5532089.1 cobalamin biosynthesis protein [Halorhodospira sp. 9621]